MNHLWIAYDALLVAMGLANVVLLFWARDRKPFLGAFTGFYATFALSIAVALARRYVTFNVGSETWVTFLSYGVSTVLSYAVLAWSLRFYERSGSFALCRRPGSDGGTGDSCCRCRAAVECDVYA